MSNDSGVEEARFEFEDTLDMIPDDATVNDLVRADDSDLFATESVERKSAEEEPEDLPVPEETVEALENPSEDEDPEVEAAAEVAPEEVDNKDPQELVEVEWYGEKGKLSPNLHKMMNKQYTEKMQWAAEQRRKMIAEAEQIRLQAQKEREEALDLQARLQAHLDQNPEFKESWNDNLEIAENIRREQTLREELQTLRQTVEAEKQEREIRNAQQEIESKLATLRSSYRLEKGSNYTDDDARQMALAQVISSGYQYQLEDVYPKVVADLNQRHRSTRNAYLAKKVETARSAPTSTPKRQADRQPKKVDVRNMSWDELLDQNIKTLGLE